MDASEIHTPPPDDDAGDAGAERADTSPSGRPGVDVVTFGCRLNAYESEVIKAHADAAERSDTIVVNTCAVTGEAVRQARQAIRKLKRERPGARLVVTGCAAQVDPVMFADMAEVDAVVGNHEKMLAETWGATGSFLPPPAGEVAAEWPSKGAGSTSARPRRPLRGHLPRFAGEENDTPVLVNDIMSVTETAGHLLDGFADRARAYVQVQNGCDHRCTFCIIPYGRGNSRSVPAGEVVDQIARLAANGYPEVVLTGVDITSWGADLPGAPTLGTLVRRILKGAPDLARLRLSSLDAVEIDPELYRFVVEEPRVAPHLHLSLQAGDDMILKRMKRRHLRDDAIRLCERLRVARPEIAFGADLIAGFPTETEAMFANTLALVDDCDLAFLHVFPFSPRPGTPAARMPQLDRATVKDRAARLRAAGDAALSRWLDRHVDVEAEALVERDGFARLADFSPVRLPSGPARSGALVRVRVTGHDGRALQGEFRA